MKYYAGIGSRNAPEYILSGMRKMGILLDHNGYVLRSGDAKGCDKAFAFGATKKEIFKSKDAQPWAYEMVREYIPNDRPRETFDRWDPYIRGLLARNTMQILGKDGDAPVEFVVCWTPIGNYQTSDVGGTGYAIRCAIDHMIPVYNLNYPDQIKAFREFFKTIVKDEMVF